MGAPGRTVVPQESTRLGSRSYYTPTHVCGRALSLSPCALPGERNAERKKAGVHDDQGKKEKSERLGPRFLS